MASKPPMLWALLRCRCPKCRKGPMFTQSSVFPLRSMLQMHRHCTCCGEKLVGESNNGPGINFVLTTLLLLLNVLWYYPIFGLSYADNSIYYFLASSVLVVLLLQPWLMRWSRSVYLYLLWIVRE